MQKMLLLLHSAEKVESRLKNQENLDLPFEHSTKTPLHTMIQNGETELALALLNAGANSCALDAKGRTALHVAARYNRVDVLTELLKRPVKQLINQQQGSAKVTALHIAAKHGHVAVMNQLLEQGANPRLSTTNSYTSLHTAASHNHLDACIRLLKECDLVNQQNKKGNTPLHFAIQENNAEIATLLLLHGAKITTANEEGKTPMQMGSPAIFHRMHNENFVALEKIQVEVKRLKANRSSISDLTQKKITAFSELSKIINANPYRPLSVNVREFKTIGSHYDMLVQQDTVFHVAGKPTISQSLVDSFDSPECGKYFFGGQLAFDTVDDLVDEFMLLNPENMQPSSSNGPSSSLPSAPSSSTTPTPAVLISYFGAIPAPHPVAAEASAPPLPQPSEPSVPNMYPTPIV
jgi:hypothetical protein